jgi:hypothetical protein
MGLAHITDHAGKRTKAAGPAAFFNVANLGLGNSKVCACGY